MFAVPRLTYADADRYGIDKPDLRFDGAVRHHRHRAGQRVQGQTAEQVSGICAEGCGTTAEARSMSSPSLQRFGGLATTR